LLRDGRGTTTYHYSPISLLDEVNEHTGRTIVMAYDDDQRRVQTWFATDIAANGTVYNASNQLTVPQNWVLQTKNTLDSSGRLTRTVSWRGNVADDAHRVSDLSYNYKQVALNTVCTNAGATVGRGLGTDAGRKTERTNNMLSPAQVIQYCYDTSGRLIFRAGSSAALYKYTYDKSGNRTGDSVNSDPLTTYTFNSGNETTTSGFSYDGAGNQKTGAPFSATASVYNGFDQATSVTPAGGSTTALAAAGTTNSELVTQGSTTLTNGLPGVQALGATSYVQRDPKGGLLSLVLGSGATNEYYYVLDGQGSVTNLVDAAGTERAQYGYDAYGAHDTAVGVGGALPDNPFRYNGGRAVAVNATNQVVLYQFGERFYSPTTGRWTQQDNLEHLGNPAEGNRYAYAGGDPVNHIDPSGRNLIWDDAVTGLNVGWQIGTAVGCVGGGVVGGIAGSELGPAGAVGGFVGGCIAVGGPLGGASAAAGMLVGGVYGVFDEFL
jgi:RHS repeat-associated protein